MPKVIVNYEWRYLKYNGEWQIVYVYNFNGKPYAFSCNYADKVWLVEQHSGIEWGPPIPSPEILQALLSAVPNN